METKGIYKSRVASHNDEVIHCPKENAGRFRLEVDEHGNMHYWKVSA